MTRRDGVFASWKRVASWSSAAVLRLSRFSSSSSASIILFYHADIPHNLCTVYTLRPDGDFHVYAPPIHVRRAFRTHQVCSLQERKTNTIHCCRIFSRPSEKLFNCKFRYNLNTRITYKQSTFMARCNEKVNVTIVVIFRLKIIIKYDEQLNIHDLPF
jgi:hypothetical protein